jgi:acyl-CoA thioesterase-1
MKRLPMLSMRLISPSFLIIALVLAGCREPSLPENPVKVTVTPSSPASPALSKTQNALKIMPLGDSITNGHDVPGGYRTALWQKLTKRGYILDFVGSMQNGSRELPDRDHEGHSGWRIRDLRSQIQPWLQQTEPDIVLLMIGSNDILKNDSPETAPDRLQELLTDIFAQVPEAKVFVGSIPPMADPARDRQVREYNATIKNLISQQNAAGKQVFFVDIYPVLNLNDLPDGLHPNAQGHQKIAEAWEQALTEILQ